MKEKKSPALRPLRLSPRDARAWLPPRRADLDKGDVGHVLVLAGSRGMMGAARLCALGALRAGAGLVTLGVPESQYAAAAVGGPWEAMVMPLHESDGALPLRAAEGLSAFVEDRGVTAVALGPGLSTKPGVISFVLEVLESLEVPVVADADALNALARAGKVPHRHGPWIMTPHQGEAARLLGLTTAAVRDDRPEAARSLARKFSCVALLKGAGTLVTDGKSLFKNDAGNPGMASGGMGDVLTGIIAALAGQVKGADAAERCLRATVLGARMHGRAGDRAAKDVGPVGFTASDLAARVPSVFKGERE